MKVFCKKTKEIMDVEYDDDDLYVGYSSNWHQTIYLTSDEFEEISDELAEFLKDNKY